MLDLDHGIRNAIQNKAVRYNHLKKDFDDAPKWYLGLIRKFSDWRFQG